MCDCGGFFWEKGTSESVTAEDRMSPDLKQREVKYSRGVREECGGGVMAEMFVWKRREVAVRIVMCGWARLNEVQSLWRSWMRRRGWSVVGGRDCLCLRVREMKKLCRASTSG